MPQIILSPKYAMGDEDYYEVEIEVEFNITLDFTKGGADLLFDPVDTPKSASKKAGFEIDEHAFHEEWDKIQNNLVGPAAIDKVTIDDAEAVAEKQEQAAPAAPAARLKGPMQPTQAPQQERSLDIEEEVIDEEPDEGEKVGI